MDALKCKQNKRLPPVISEWSRVYCPQCSFYHNGRCNNPTRTTEDGPCPFDNVALPLMEVTDPVKDVSKVEEA